MDAFLLFRLVMVLQIGGALLRDPACAIEILTGWRRVPVAERRPMTPSAAYPSAIKDR